MNGSWFTLFGWLDAQTLCELDWVSYRGLVSLEAGTLLALGVTLVQRNAYKLDQFSTLLHILVNEPRKLFR